MKTTKQRGLLNAVYRLWKRQQTKQLKNMLEFCGTDVSVPYNVKIYGSHLQLGNHVHLGEECIFMCAKAPIVIGDHVMTGPRVTMISGDHRIDVVGKYMTDIKNEDKLPENDQPIILKGDNWIGANVTILKGVTVGEGAVIAAGALVCEEVPAYSIVGGVPAKVIKTRFTEEDIKRIIRILVFAMELVMIRKEMKLLY